MEAAGERERESEEYKMVACVFTYIKEPSWPFTYKYLNWSRAWATAAAGSRAPPGPRA